MLSSAHWKQKNINQKAGGEYFISFKYCNYCHVISEKQSAHNPWFCEWTFSASTETSHQLFLYNYATLIIIKRAGLSWSRETFLLSTSDKLQLF